MRPSPNRVASLPTFLCFDRGLLRFSGEHDPNAALLPLEATLRSDATMARRRIRIEGPGASAVSGLVDSGRNARVAIVLAHGAGADMHHPFMEATARGLAKRGAAVLRYQFPAMERGGHRPDRPAVAQAVVRAAVAEAVRRFPDLDIVAGGKSFGGRMTSLAQAQLPLVGVRGLFFLGFPLHPAGKSSTERAAHLSSIQIPMLFMQGARDSLGPASAIEKITATLRPRPTVHAIADADHSFHVLKRSGVDDADVHDALMDAMMRWTHSMSGRHRLR